MDEPQSPEPSPADASSAENALAPAEPAADYPISTGKGVKETIESILIAFILAFVFRAFVVEAFVIPTGSMATTLLGAHMRFTCKECGYTFDANYPSRSNGNEDIEIPLRAGQERELQGRPRTFAIYCPNCRHKVSRDEATNPFVRYGDRILVLKYLYIPWISSPHRWDVVVFKTPTDRPAYAINYIKRLIGLPGEELMILDGDVYVKMGNAWQIQTKPKFAQDALWRIIYDNDYRPLNQNRSDGWTLPWVHNDGDGWDTGNAEDARVIVFNNKDGGGRLRFDPTRDPRYNPQSAPGGYFTDWLAYDATMGQDLSRYASGDSFASEGDYMVYTVSDLKLQFFYDRKAGDGPLMARMTKLNHEFVLTFTPDAVRLKHTHGGDLPAEIPPLHAFVTSKARGPIKVEFSNVDYQVSVRLNGELIFQTTPQQYHPDVKDLLARHERRRESRTPFGEPSVTIDAARQQALLSHVSLWRDVYYTPEDANGRELVHGRPRDPVKLGGDDYFVMGDNSAASYDARFWTDEIHLPDEGLNVESGRVPGRFMLGRAFFVYWPAGYRPFERAPALVPDFGDMRLIH